MTTKALATVLCALVLAAMVAVAQDKKPVNAKCPVKTGEAAKADITSDYEGKTVGFCCGNCKGAFDKEPAKFASKIPELKTPAKAEAKSAGPVNTNCPVDSNGVNPKYVVSVQGKVIEYCLKVSAPYLHPGEKTARSDEDKARITYECEVCGVKGEVEAEFKHKPDCKPSFGDGIKKVCSKTGTAPHRSEK